MKEYKARKGSGFGKNKAITYGTRLDELAVEHDGTITPILVIDDARDQDSPLHDYFEWDDSVASEQYRKWQARRLIRSIIVITCEEDSDDLLEIEINNFHNVTISNNDNVRVYATIEKISEDDTLFEQVIANAIAEIKLWKDKYKTYKEFKGIIREVNKTEMKFKSNSIKKRKRNVSAN